MTNATPKPSADLRTLDRLIGTWTLSGDTTGTVSYEWSLDGFFLIQHIDMTLSDHSTKGIEIIGHLQPYGEAPSAEIRSRVYDNSGNTFDFVYEMDGDTLTIWAGERGSPAYFRGTFSKDGDTNTGEWVYPGGGGYRSTMTRAKRSAQTELSRHKRTT